MKKSNKQKELNRKTRIRESGNGSTLRTKVIKDKTKYDRKKGKNDEI